MNLKFLLAISFAAGAATAALGVSLVCRKKMVDVIGEAQKCVDQAQRGLARVQKQIKQMSAESISDSKPSNPPRQPIMFEPSPIEALCEHEEANGGIFVDEEVGDDQDEFVPPEPTLLAAYTAVLDENEYEPESNYEQIYLYFDPRLGKAGAFVFEDGSLIEYDDICAMVGVSNVNAIAKMFLDTPEQAAARTEIVRNAKYRADYIINLRV
jgi:hypothetical protein